MSNSEFFMRGVYIGVIAVGGLTVILGSLLIKMAVSKIRDIEETVEEHDCICKEVPVIMVKQEHANNMLETVVQHGVDFAVTKEKLVAVHRRIDDLFDRLEKKGVI